MIQATGIEKLPPFNLEQFDLLDAWAHKPWTGSAVETTVREKLRKAHYATKDWALALQARRFPAGYVRARRAPLNQAGNFAPYTWAKIYPNRTAPEKLAYTVGIDREGCFTVKIDTVELGGPVRTAFEEMRDSADRPGFTTTLPAADGVGLSIDQLVDWSMTAIDGFDPGYGEVVRRLNLSAPLRLVTDLAEARKGFADWRSAMLEGSITKGSYRWVPDAMIIMSNPKPLNEGPLGG